ncbi:calcium/sodium antiporter [Methanobacterium alcaliphilum]|uniref:calcium/sodium antiporter n=1 Tax=Methanobacterium alcaliphilum TaxID=392018 RepID=UPI00200AE4FD|nr:calcium/sodium antiporter [Methanobacterium alcaliphilum]MCK9152521.1 calcium/sodium antiporter [Methanobacterium alcaliphilum]
MIDIIVLIGALIVSLIIVIKSADVFVDNIVEIGGALGISQIILGVTASAIGTSLPEFGSAMIASLSGSAELGVGTVIGSNIWNIAGILGISATVAGVIGTDSKGLSRDVMAVLGTGFILIFFMFFGDINRTASVFMILLYLIYLWRLIKAQKDYAQEKEDAEEKTEETKTSKFKSINRKQAGMAILGLGGLIVGCRILVYSGTELAAIAGIPEMIMGLFTLAIGTSIPELVVTLSSAMKGLHELSIGTVLGSNTFNILIGIGVPALFMTIPVDHLSLAFDAPVMIFITLLLIGLIKLGGNKLNRVGGIILLATYITYAVLRLYVLA